MESWQNLIRASLVDIAEGYKIKPDHLRWYAAMHVKEKHIHVHMVIFSTGPKEGYLTKQGIKQIKSALVRQVYKDDLLNIYQKQTVHRDHLQENALAVMDSLIQQMQDGEISNPKIELLITELAERLQNYSGKKVYGYLPPATKCIVDAIVDELAGDERVAEAIRCGRTCATRCSAFTRKRNRSVCRSLSRRSSACVQSGHTRGSADDGAIAIRERRVQR